MTDTSATPPPATAPNASPFWWPEPRTFIVGWMMISSFVIVVLFWWKPPAADNQLLNTLIGIYVSTGFVAAIQWWMGSSKGSEDKSAAINRQLGEKP